MELNNPYLEEKRRLTVEYDRNPSNELKDQLETIESQSRAYTRSILSQNSSEVEKVRERKIALKQDFPSLRKQYKEAIAIYREALRLVKDMIQVKKQLRIELGIGKKEVNLE